MSIAHDPVTEILAALEAGGYAPRPSGPDQWSSRCPVHNGSKSNLIVTRGDDGRLLLYCHHSDGCGFRDVLSALNITAARPSTNGTPSTNHTMSSSPAAKKPKTLHASADRAIRAARWTCKDKDDPDWKPDVVKLAGRWTYHGKEGETLLIVVRFQLPDGSKSYSQVHPVEGGWYVGMPAGSRPLYRLPEVLDADRIYFTEGEKAADAIAALGLVATTTPGGAKGVRKADLAPIAGRHVVVLPDNDVPGREYAAKLVGLLTKAGAASVKVVKLPNLPDKGDVVDWLENVVPDQWGPEDCRASLERMATHPIEPTPDQRVDEARARILEVDDEVDDPNLDAVLAGCNRTDYGNGERLVSRHRRDIRYCAAWESWLAWDGRRWTVDDDDEVRRRAKSTVRAILNEAGTITDDHRRKAHAAFAFASESSARITAMIHEAKSEAGVPVKHQDLDADPWLLNCLNGTLDLRTGKLQPHRRSDLITKLCPVEYRPDATCPLWNSTLRLFFAEDQELIHYWQRLCGYFLSGVVRDHILPVCYGVGSNGKSTMLETQMAVMGEDYAMKAPSGFLMSKHQESHPCDKADLFGKRLVVAIETEEGRRLDESLIKELTGGDTVRARRMRENFWQFRPTHKVALATNHRPTVRGTDNGIWRRLRLVPFAVKMEGDKADTNMGEKLRAEYPGILAWAVRGCLAWQKEGVVEPACVAEATADYRSEQDVFGSFMEERTIQEDCLKTRCNILYNAYREWVERSGERATTMKVFGQTMKDRGFETKTSNGKWYLRIGLKPSYEDDSEVAEQQQRPIVA